MYDGVDVIGRMLRASRFLYVGRVVRATMLLLLTTEQDGAAVFAGVFPVRVLCNDG